jgi:hypothetical protein
MWFNQLDKQRQLEKPVKILFDLKKNIQNDIYFFKKILK